MSRRPVPVGRKKSGHGRARKHQGPTALVVMAVVWAAVTAPTAVYVCTRIASGRPAHVPIALVMLSLFLLVGTILTAVEWWRR